MPTMNCRAVLFDLDGTLVDSSERIMRLWREWGERHGIAWDAILEVMHGRRAAETIRIVAPHLPVEEEIAALEADEIADMDGVKAYPGTSALLGKLDSSQWAIVTSGTRQVAEARLRHVNLPLPDVFICGDDVRRGKPDPEGYDLASRILKVPPGACVVVEDSPAGVRAGKAAGMRVVALSTTHLPEELSGADEVVPQPAALDLSLAGGEITIHLRG